MHAYNGASHTKFAVIRSVCNQSGRVPDCVCNSILISPCWTVKCRLQQMSHVSPGVLSLSLSLPLSLCIWGLLSSLLTPRLHLHHPKKTHSRSCSRFHCHCHSLCSAIVIVVVIIIVALAHHATAASALAYANVIIWFWECHTNIQIYPRAHTYIRVQREPQCRSARKVIKTRDK